MANSSFLRFPTHKNFELCDSYFSFLEDSVDSENIVVLLDSVISVFYSNLNNIEISLKPVLIFNSLFKNPLSDAPEILKTKNVSLLFLNVQGRT